MTTFKIESPTPAGDQPNSIKQISSLVKENTKDIVLAGVTGSGKTLTMAHVIANNKRPSLIMAPNKTLAAQLFGEMKEFFPNNFVEYFVSYYDYYQPEAYIPHIDTYINKESSINEHIDQMRHSATRSILEQKNTIVVASVSCIYGLGDVNHYKQMVVSLTKDKNYCIQKLKKDLVNLQYKRNDMGVLTRGQFRFRGDTLDIFPSHYDETAWRIVFFDEEIESIYEWDPLTGEKQVDLSYIKIYPNSHYVLPKPSLQQAIQNIEAELEKRLHELKINKNELAYQRLEERVKFDIEMLKSSGFCSGIENYSRYLSGRAEGEPPSTLFDYFSENSLLFLDESHITVPQIRGMYNGDASRKQSLVEHGFRLPSCLDNRPLKFEEWDIKRPQTIYVSATPGNFEKELTSQIIHQIIRPTGLLDPECSIRPTKNQIDDLMHECQIRAKQNERVLITTLTKKMSEDLCEYFKECGLSCEYLHSDIGTIERTTLIQDLRQGTFDILIGINLLREGLDIPECSLVAILDADKEGFLRSKTSLIQTIGRAARNINGTIIMYADRITDSMEGAINETKKRRDIQLDYNKKNNITPKSIKKKIQNILQTDSNPQKKQLFTIPNNPEELQKSAKKIEQKMFNAAEELDFEKAILYRNELHAIKEKLIKL